MAKTMKSHIHLHKEKEGERVGREFKEEKNFQELIGRISRKCAIGISECGCYIRIWSYLRKVP